MSPSLNQSLQLNLLGTTLYDQVIDTLRTFTDYGLYVPSPSTCFTDTACTTQAVLDGNIGGVLESAKPGGAITTYDFSAGLSPFSAPSGNASVIGGRVVVDSSGTWGDLNGPATTFGKTYKLTIDLVALTGGNFYFGINGLYAYAGANLAPGTYTGVLTSNGNTIKTTQSSGAGRTYTIDNISIQEVGATITQATAGYQPKLKQSAGGIWYIDQDGVDDKLSSTFGASFASATVIKSILGTGHVTASSQNISAATNWTDDNLCGLIVTSSTPNAAQLALLERYADHLAGVSL